MQIDLEPTEYRKQRNGRWVQNIDKPMARWMAAAGIVFLAYFAWAFANEGGHPAIVLFSAAMGVCVGACLILSLKSTDW
jgi:hypothetical protein